MRLAPAGRRGRGGRRIRRPPSGEFDAPRASLAQPCRFRRAISASTISAIISSRLI
ncbi:unnamed protein product [Spirodela intermedia]|uniref:Uncharacterized protein n=1 Tax=Spirodela intermedia TaxID=51605 RepID=A0A811G8G7_SPIIN|nr:unnamed protein product [Spirodela intermedia]